jgi:hypothetical protein
MDKRTIIDFTVGSAGDTWKTIHQWARETGYRVKKTGPTWKRFQKGYGFLVSPSMFEVTIEGDKVHLEAWVRFVNPLERFILSLSNSPPEMGLHVPFAVGGLQTKIAGKIARNAVNKLLRRLKQPLIE